MTDKRIARRYASAVFKLGMQEGNDVISTRGQTFLQLKGMLEIPSWIMSLRALSLQSLKKRRSLPTFLIK